VISDDDNPTLAINGSEGFAIPKNMPGDIPLLQEPQDIISSTWQSIMEGGIDHNLMLDRYKL
jgi:hypothetical protein